ncbi:spexin prohormone 2-like [Callorhinchus milii]|uniref:spexin prohormone 2-like n=1 Tax=Callorhinchus milii TaxID=7868 RepID=UPI0004571781|nr:spexin prohormone 2-like [Callorhinchus milii]|eukprot:gi/632941019/ref/XP_007885644.1/ PREDICTED: spexin-like [Callorhinchus milii]
MKVLAAVMCTCVVVVTFLVVESCCTEKNKANPRNWGPQSMLYLKGKYGKRVVGDDGYYNTLDMNIWNLLLRDYKKARSSWFSDHWKQRTDGNREVAAAK